MRSAENRLEIVKKQAIGQVLHVELQIQAGAFFLKQICTHGKIQNRSWLDPAALSSTRRMRGRVRSFKIEPLSNVSKT